MGDVAGLDTTPKTFQNCNRDRQAGFGRVTLLLAVIGSPLLYVIFFAIRYGTSTQVRHADASFISRSIGIGVFQQNLYGYRVVGGNQFVKLILRDWPRRYSVKIGFSWGQGGTNSVLLVPICQVKRFVSHFDVLANFHILRWGSSIISKMPIPCDLSYWRRRVVKLWHKVGFPNVICEPHNWTLFYSESIGGGYQGLRCSESRALGSTGGYVGGCGLFPNFDQGIIHSIGLLPSIARIADHDEERHDFKPGLWIFEKFSDSITFHKILNAIEASLFLTCGMFCLVTGWFLIRVETAQRATALGALGTGILGLFLLFCAQRFLWGFLDLIG